MELTNTIPIVVANHPSPADWTAWNAVALAAGAFLVGVYHHLIAAGGLKTIARKLWDSSPPDSPPDKPNQP